MNVASGVFAHAVVYDLVIPAGLAQVYVSRVVVCDDGESSPTCLINPSTVFFETSLATFSTAFPPRSRRPMIGGLSFSQVPLPLSFKPRAEVLRELRWKNGVKCVWCGSQDVVKNGSYLQHYQKYMCRGCGRFFNDKTGTIFEYSKLDVREWLYITRELEKNKSINRISKDLGRRYKHVMRIAHEIMRRVEARRFLERLSGVVEMDEMYISTGQKGVRCILRRPRKHTSPPKAENHL
jgi:transposase-like protein